MCNIEKWCRWTYLQSRNKDTDIENKPSLIPISPGQREGWRVGTGSGVFPRGTSSLLPVPLPANLCAFLLQLSEGLTKGQAQLCSNILIIYCSAAHISVHHHRERARRLKRSFHFHYWARFCSTQCFLHHLMSFPMDSDMLERRTWRRRQWQVLHFSVGIRAFKMCSSLLNVIIW